MDRKILFREAFLERVGTPLSENVPLSAMSSFGIGGPADFFFEARTEEDLKKALGLAFKEKYPCYVIGGGTNILFDDAGYRGLIIRDRLEGIVREEDRLRIFAGTGLAAVVHEALAAGLAGLEFLAGIPGTLGGAVSGNAGAFGAAIGDRVAWATLLSPGGVQTTVGRESLAFGYRTSILKQKSAVVLSAVLLCTPGDRKGSEARVRDIIERRKSKQPPWGTPSAGSYFKNPGSATGVKTAAGYLLEQAGAKGLAIGDAAVYDNHCNFIVNRGNAMSRDVLRLAEELKERVFRTFGVRLEEEVIHLRADASLV
jgi:UDP-N-acetylmuramate dehydrogenase